MYRAMIYIITNQNRELYSVRPQDFEHGRPDYEHFKTAYNIGLRAPPMTGHCVSSETTNSLSLLNRTSLREFHRNCINEILKCEITIRVQ